MPAAMVIAAKDLRQRLRDRSFFLVGVVAPFGLALIFSFLLGPITEGTFRPAIGLVDSDQSQVSVGFSKVLESLHDGEAISLVSNLTEDAAQRMTEEGELSAAYVIRDGFGASVMRGEAAAIDILGNVDAPTGTAVAKAVAAGFAERIRLTQLAVGGIAIIERSAPDPGIGERAAAGEPLIDIGDVAAKTRELDATTYYTAAMAVFFLFFTVQIGVTSLLDETRDGTMARLQAAPISRVSIVAGKGVTSLVLGLTSMLVLAVASMLLIGAEWGNPLGALLLIGAVVVAAVGIVALIAGFANTPESAGSIQSIVAVTLGALGGSFFQVSLGEGLLSKAALLTPHHWFFRGLADLAGGVGVGGIMDSVGAMLAFAVVTGAIGWRFLKQKVAA